jgi:hypothetical protein
MFDFSKIPDLIPNILKYLSYEYHILFLYFLPYDKLKELNENRSLIFNNLMVSNTLTDMKYIIYLNRIANSFKNNDLEYYKNETCNKDNYFKNNNILTFFKSVKLYFLLVKMKNYKFFKYTMATLTNVKKMEIISNNAYIYRYLIKHHPDYSIRWINLNDIVNNFNNNGSIGDYEGMDEFWKSYKLIENYNKSSIYNYLIFNMLPFIRKKLPCHIFQIKISYTFYKKRNLCIICNCKSINNKYLNFYCSDQLKNDFTFKMCFKCYQLQPLSYFVDIYEEKLYFRFKNSTKLYICNLID